MKKAFYRSIFLLFYMIDYMYILYASRAPVLYFNKLLLHSVYRTPF